MKTALCTVLLAASPALAVERTVDPSLRVRGFESLSQWAPPVGDPYVYGVLVTGIPDDCIYVDGPDTSRVAEAPHPYLSPDRVLARGWMEPVPPGLILDGWAGTSFYLPMLPP